MTGSVGQECSPIRGQRYIAAIASGPVTIDRERRTLKGGCGATPRWRRYRGEMPGNR